MPLATELNVLTDAICSTVMSLGTVMHQSPAGKRSLWPQFMLHWFHLHFNDFFNNPNFYLRIGWALIFLILIKYVIFWLRLFWIFLKELTMKSILFKENVNLFYIYFCRIWILTIKVTVYHGMAVYMLWKIKTRKSIQVINKTAENQKTSWAQEDHYLHRILYLHDIGIHDRQT